MTLGAGEGWQTRTEIPQKQKGNTGNRAVTSHDLSSTARAYTLSEIITIGIVAAVLVVAVVGGVIACAVRARSYRSAEALEPLLGETFRRYSEDDRRFDKSQSVVWTHVFFYKGLHVFNFCFLNSRPLLLIKLNWFWTKSLCVHVSVSFFFFFLRWEGWQSLAVDLLFLTHAAEEVRQQSGGQAAWSGSIFNEQANCPWWTAQNPSSSFMLLMYSCRQRVYSHCLHSGLNASLRPCKQFAVFFFPGF